MVLSRRIPILLGLGAASVLVFTGCAPGAPAADDGRIAVVTSTNVYGDIAKAVGGDAVDVVAIIDSAAQDPHSYEVSARDELRISRADLVIENGGGYDGFMDAAIEATATAAPVITAVEFSHDWPENGGHETETHDAEDPAEHSDDPSTGSGTEHEDHGHVEGFNEHVWYDPHTIAHVVEEIAHELSELAPESAADFAANAAALTADIEGIEADLEAIGAVHGGAKVFVTEPVPLYLIEAAGLENVTPDAFSEAVEEGQDVPPSTLLESLDLFDPSTGSGGIDVVIVNAQTGGAETTQVIAEAEAGGIPVLEFTETLPEGQTYVSWMTDNAARLSAALET